MKDVKVFRQGQFRTDYLLVKMNMKMEEEATKDERMEIVKKKINLTTNLKMRYAGKNTTHC